MQQVVIVTGGSSGIGLATARAFRAAGCMVYELSRRDVVHQDGIVHISGDVTDEKRVREAVEEVESAQGRVDILVCNAGFGISGAAEFTENQDAKQQKRAIDALLRRGHSYGAIRQALNELSLDTDDFPEDG